jgi:hypothetical protein
LHTSFRKKEHTKENNNKSTGDRELSTCGRVVGCKSGIGASGKCFIAPK